MAWPVEIVLDKGLFQHNAVGKLEETGTTAEM